MMDTDILFRDGRRFSNDFNDMPSLMSSDSSYSTNCDGSDSETFSSWNFNMGLSNDLELMLDRFGFDPIGVDAYCPVGDEWRNAEVPTFGNESLDHEAILSNLEFLKQEPNDCISRVKQESDISSTDFHKAVANIKKELPGYEEFTAPPNIGELQFPERSESQNFAVADLPPNLDLCSFINGEDITAPFEPPPVKQIKEEPKFKAGRKKIDLQAQRYIIEDEDQEEEEENVDIETISESGNNPVLEAGDLNSLLEQFEATEVIPEKTTTVDSNESVIDANLVDVSAKKNKSKNEIKPVKKSSQGAFMDASKQGGCTSSTQLKYVKPSDKVERIKCKSLPIKSPATNAPSTNNKHIIEALPQELIARIKESGKRKRIAIIDPVPNNCSKRRKTQENITQVQPTAVPSQQNVLNLQSIVLDHNYCSSISSHKTTVVKKDSGYISTEDEDKILHSQPVVKNADGKLMISLLKTNTIKSNTEEKNRKKLNIEEYKKRRQGVLSTPASLSNSPMSSNCSSPLPEDERTRRLKHEEKLRKMALELLNTPPKSMCANAKSETNDQKAVPVKTTPPPVDMDVVTIVSIGVNTDITGKDPFAPAEKLEEIKPLLEQASSKINSNSLINSLIENIPKVIKSDVSTNTPIVKKEHGEDKTIIYLPKNRKLPQTSDTAVQTSITLLGNNKRRYRHRRDSSSSSSSCSSSSEDSEGESSKRTTRFHGSRYSGSRSSRSSSTDSSSSSRSSRSRYRSMSRSPSPKNKRRRRRRAAYDEEYVQDIEERRVVYVGKLAPRTTKEDLYRRFSRFGSIKTISIHFRNAGDNYGFVTFVNKMDAYKAIEHGNDNPYDVQYDLSFGGRRLFCKTSYSDLDNMREDASYASRNSSSGDSFDRLLKEMQEKLKKRKV